MTWFGHRQIIHKQFSRPQIRWLDATRPITGALLKLEGSQPSSMIRKGLAIAIKCLTSPFMETQSSLKSPQCSNMAVKSVRLTPWGFTSNRSKSRWTGMFYQSQQTFSRCTKSLSTRHLGSSITRVSIAVTSKSKSKPSKAKLRAQVKTILPSMSTPCLWLLITHVPKHPTMLHLASIGAANERRAKIATIFFSESLTKHTTPVKLSL